MPILRIIPRPAWESQLCALVNAGAITYHEDILQYVMVSRWLDSACDAQSIRESHPEYSDIKVTQLIDQAKEVRLCLREDKEPRLRFWRMLLSEAGLGKHLQPQGSLVRERQET